MKQKNRCLAMLVFCLLLFAAGSVIRSVPVQAAGNAAKATVKDGWNGDRYYKDGAYVKGWLEIGKKTYYFTKWGRKVTGIRKISKKYYAFTASGALIKTSRKIGKINYYLNDQGCLEAYGEGKTWYWPSGKKMTAAQQLDCITFRRARRLVSKLTKPSQSKEEKLYTCFMWVKHHPYLKQRRWSYTEDWPARYANDLFLGKGGCCRSDASALAYMLRAIGYTDVYVCQDGKTEAATAWVQLNGKIYDTLFSWRKNGMTKYYGGTYKQTNFYLDNKQKVAVGFE